MANYKDYLITERSSSAAVYHQFLLIYSENKAVKFHFFEGWTDRLYYLVHIRKHFDEDALHLFDCDGREGVISTYKKIKSGSNRVKRCWFYIDRDHSDYGLGEKVGSRKVFTTCGYSIENYMATESFVKFVMMTHAPNWLSPNDKKKILINYRKRHSEFVDESRTLIAWAILAKKKFGRLNWPKNTIHKLFDIKDTKKVKVKKGEFEKLSPKVCGDEFIPTKTDVDTCLTLLNSKDHKLWLRGKFEFEFMKIFLRSVFDEIKRKQKLKTGTHQNIRFPEKVFGEGAFTTSATLACPDKLEIFFTR